MASRSTEALALDLLELAMAQPSDARAGVRLDTCDAGEPLSRFRPLKD